MPLEPPYTNQELNGVLVNLLWTPRKLEATILTAVAVDTEVLGDVHAETGVTEAIGVPGSTVSFVRENAQVVTDVGPPEHVDPTTQIGVYQAVALKVPPVAGTVNVAAAVVNGVALMSQNMSS
jgi:hypothetical protein